MIHLVFCALITAGLAQRGAELADCGRVPAVAGHDTSGQAANLRAIHIERDTAGHGGDILFLEARCRAKIACICTAVANINTALELHIVHDVLLDG